MALKDSLCNKRSKRLSYVSLKSNSESEDMNILSPGNEGNERRKNEVRRGISVKKLMKDGENYKVDEDHIYTSLKPPRSEALEVVSSTRKGRKRNLSEESEEKPSKQKCSSINAFKARLNRERKKKYISSLETENVSLRKQNDEIRRKLKTQDKNISFMKQEILYLKSVILNSKELGKILHSLKETTGLPITSSSFNQDEVKDCTHSDYNFSKGSDSFKTENDYPRIRSVNSGSNFPILEKDINLSSSSDSSVMEMSDIEMPLFDFEKEIDESSLPRLDYGIPSESIFNFNPQDVDLGFEDCINFNDKSNNITSDVGICLHVNQKRISLEMCSICSSKALSSTKLYPDLCTPENKSALLN